MSSHLLRTKFYVPTRPMLANGVFFVPRLHLTQKLNETVEPKVPATLAYKPASPEVKS